MFFSFLSRYVTWPLAVYAPDHPAPPPADPLPRAGRPHRDRKGIAARRKAARASRRRRA